MLEKYYAVQLFPNKTTLKEISSKTGLTESQVYFWFARKREKIRKEKCEAMPSRCKCTYIDRVSTMSLFLIECLSIFNMSIKHTYEINMSTKHVNKTYMSIKHTYEIETSF